MTSAMLGIIAPLILIVAILSMPLLRHNKSVKRTALIFIFLSIVMWLCGCATPDNDGDIAVIIASKGTVFEVYALDNRHCNMIIKADNGLMVSILKNNLYFCKEFKKGDRVLFSAVLQPSPITPGGVKKL